MLGASEPKMTDRVCFGFTEKAEKAFAFLVDAGFTEVEALPTLVRYQRDGVEVDVYHGRRSYEVGAGVSFSGVRYSLPEIVRAGAGELVCDYKNQVSRTPDALDVALGKMSDFMRAYGMGALSGDADFFFLLGQEREKSGRKYSLDILAEQLRPKAEQAFRLGDYMAAAALYTRIRDRLTPAEVRKLNIAENKSRTK
jgi:hypothetical protein